MVYNNLIRTLGDHPEIQFESGNLHGGHFPCLCGCNAKDFADLENVYTHKILSQEERRQKVILILDHPLDCQFS